MQWISVSERVPEDRRAVLAWGEGGFSIGGYQPLQPLRKLFLGSTRFNPTRTGGSFDVERHQRFRICVVTHWAEIEGPNKA